MILIGCNPSARGRFGAGSGGLGIPPERAGVVWRAGDGGDQGEAQRRACQGEHNVVMASSVVSDMRQFVFQLAVTRYRNNAFSVQLSRPT